MADGFTNPLPPDGGQGDGRLPTDSAAGSLRVLGDFELGQEIGRGGMGIVYEAWQRSLQRKVALKVLSSYAGASPAVIERFRREAQAAAKLHHGHIVPIFAQGEDRGVYYYAMELVDGASVHALITEGRMRQLADTDSVDLAETIPIARTSSASRGESAFSASASAENRNGGERVARGSSGSASGSLSQRVDPWGVCSPMERFVAIAQNIANAADALEYAHQHGVIHRDIKPHNLLLGHDGRLRITDFGLARLAEQPGVTVTGEVLGSPLYMSPEQILAGPASVTAQSDVYSLGVTLYEWLVFEPPFPGETRDQVLTRILRSEPPPLRSHNAAIPVDLETICAKAIQRDVRRRYGSAGQFRDDLLRFASHRPIQARRDGLLRRARKYIGRHEAAVTAVVAVVLVLVLGFSLIVQRKEVRRQARATRIAQETAAQMQTRAEEAGDTAQQLLEAFRATMPAEIGAVVTGADVAAPVARGLLRSARSLTPQIAPTAPTAPADSAALGTPEGLARRAALDLYEAVRNPNWPPPVIDATDLVGMMLREIVQARSTDPLTALRMLNLFLQTSPDNVQARLLHAVVSAEAGDYEGLNADAEELIRLNGEDAHAYVWRSLARVLLGQGEPALLDSAQAATLNPRSVWACAARGLALLQLGRTEEAAIAFDEARVRAPGLLVALLGQALTHAGRNAVEHAINYLNVAIELAPTDVAILSLRGQYFAALGRFAEAARDFQAAIQLGGPSPALQIQLLMAQLGQQRHRGGESMIDKPSMPSPPPSTVPESLENTQGRGNATSSMKSWQPGLRETRERSPSGAAVRQVDSGVSRRPFRFPGR